MSFIIQLELAFQKNSNPKNALAMAKYMRNHFSFFGIKTEKRRLILKEIWKDLLEFPEVIERFLNSDNLWLNSVILFQLAYKNQTNFDLLKSLCEKHKISSEFFNQKAI